MTEADFATRVGENVTPAPDSPPATVTGPVAPAFNYYVWLADGTVLQLEEIPDSPRYIKTDGTDVAIIGAYPR